jgi:hypothetical protein
MNAATSRFYSVLIHLPGNNQVRVIVPPFEPTDDGPIVDAIDTVQTLLKVPSSQWVARIEQEIEVSNVEIEQ